MSTPPNTPGHVSRRAFIVLGAGVAMTGCGETTKSARALPGPPWDAHPSADLDSGRSDPGFHAGMPGAAPTEASMPGVMSRSTWAAGAPVPALLNRMLPIRFVTVHHDGMDAFTSTSERASAARIERIRVGHRARGWGDIGYHFAVDRAGRVHACRPLAWQGAHVKDHNEGNIGIVALGNFEIQQPSTQQVAALMNHVRRLRTTYRVSVTSVRTHQEWAATACPGANMQRQVVMARAAGRV